MNERKVLQLADKAFQMPQQDSTDLSYYDKFCVDFAVMKPRERIAALKKLSKKENLNFPFVEYLFRYGVRYCGLTLAKEQSLYRTLLRNTQKQAALSCLANIAHQKLLSADVKRKGFKYETSN